MALLDNSAPPPLAPLTHTIISPANIAIEQRRENAQPLSWSQRRRIRREIHRLDKQLHSREARTLLALRKALYPRLAEFRTTYAHLQTALAQQPGNENLLREWSELQEHIAPLYARWRTVQHDLQAFQEAHTRRSVLAQRLEDHRLYLAREKTETQLRKLMFDEARIYEKLIVDKWTRLGFCNRVRKGDKEVVQRVQFSEVDVTLDAIYFKIDASYQTAFKNWKTNLPDGVYITSQLLDPVTLDELSLSCQRQVTGLKNTNGAWVVVHRLDSLDGLMNYVQYQDVMDRYPHKHNNRMPVCVGVGGNRQISWVNIADFPHWLIAGYTNSGKSNMVNVILCTLITKHRPADLRLVLIDLKGGLEFNFYEGIPHLHGEIADTITKVAARLTELESVMHDRFRRFKGVAKRLDEYQVRRPGDNMPRIVCVFDEVASIMDHGDNTKRILSSLREIVRMGRAVGIHVILATQRPDVKAIEGQIKANLSVRISGRMTTSADSVTVLGNSLAKDLAAVPGRMVMQIGPDPVAIQTPHILNDDLAHALKAAVACPAPPPLDVPENKTVHEAWTPERIIEFAIKHMNGLLSGRRIFDALHDDSVTASQVYALVEKAWSMCPVTYNGRLYNLQKRRGGGKYLTPQDPDTQIQKFSEEAVSEPAEEAVSEPAEEAAVNAYALLLKKN